MLAGGLSGSARSRICLSTGRGRSCSRLQRPARGCRASSTPPRAAMGAWAAASRRRGRWADVVPASSCGSGARCSSTCRSQGAACSSAHSASSACPHATLSCGGGGGQAGRRQVRVGRARWPPAVAGVRALRPPFPPLPTSHPARLCTHPEALHREQVFGGRRQRDGQALRAHRRECRQEHRQACKIDGMGGVGGHGRSAWKAGGGGGEVPVCVCGAGSRAWEGRGEGRRAQSSAHAPAPPAHVSAPGRPRCPPTAPAPGPG